MNRVIGFTKARAVTYTVSLVLLVAMFVVTFVRGGFNLGIDFQPGVSIQARIDTGKPATIEDVKAALSSLPSVQVQALGAPAEQQYTIRVHAYKEDQEYATQITRQIKQLLGDKLGISNVLVGSEDKLATTIVGPRFAQSLVNQAFLLVGLALVIILIYIWVRFRIGYAFAAIIATVHVLVFMVGFIGLFQIEVSSAIIAAVLTVIGYSLNDTVVVFDRIRDNEKIMADQKLGFTFDSAITQTLSRTIVTSLTVFIAVLAIFLFTKGEIHDFATAFMVGVIVSTYSSIFIASPILLDIRNGQNRRKRIKEAKAVGTPRAAIQEALDAEQPVSVNAAEIDADAVARQIRRERQDKGKN